MTRLPPAEKIPLAVRKNIRDKWDANKESLEADLSKACGIAWTIDINPNAVYPYTKEGTYAEQSLGSALIDYVRGAISGLGRFKYEFGDSVVNDLNAICHARVLTLDVDESGLVETNGVDVVDGKLRLLFKPESLPESWGSTLSFKAKNSIDSGYDKKIEKIRSGIADIIKNQDIKLVPNFEDTFQKLKTAATSGTKMAVENWEKYLGPFTAEYFTGVESTLRREGFASDDMLQEGFNEAINKGEMVFRIIDSLKDSDAYNECAIEDGSLYLQCTPATWGRNITTASRKLIDLL